MLVTFIHGFAVFYIKLEVANKETNILYQNLYIMNPKSLQDTTPKIFILPMSTLILINN